MKTRSIYIVSVFLIIIIVVSILYYMFVEKNSKSEYEGTLVYNEIIDEDYFT